MSTERGLGGCSRPGSAPASRITTGSSTLMACKEFEEAGYEIVGILAVVDREQGGRKTLEEKYKHVRTLFKTSDFPKLASLAQKGGARAAA